MLRVDFFPAPLRPPPIPPRIEVIVAIFWSTGVLVVGRLLVNLLFLGFLLLFLPLPFLAILTGFILI